MSWSRMPTAWIVQEQGLCAFRWTDGASGCVTAALVLYIALVHHADAEDGIARLSYDDLQRMTGFSRDTLSASLKYLVLNERIETVQNKRGWYSIRGWSEIPFGKIPARALYVSGVLTFAHRLTLRARAELDAMKLYLLFAAFRNDRMNSAFIGYEKIAEYSGIPKNRISGAITVLAGLDLIIVDHIPSDTGRFASVRGYRLRYLESYRHSGTRAAD